MFSYMTFLVHSPVPDSLISILPHLGKWLSECLMMDYYRWGNTSSLYFIVGSIVGSKLFPKRESLDESSIIAWCGAVCSQCSYYLEGECPSCPEGALEIQNTCPIFLCASQRGALCSDCERRMQCDLFANERECCPFGKDLFPFRTGRGYVIYEKNPEISSRIFKNYVIRGDYGLLVSRRYPEQFFSKYNLEGVNAVWLSTAEGEKNWIDPCNLSKLHHVIRDFINHASLSIILFEGFEYLMVRNSFMSALKFIQSLMDEIVLSKSKLMLTINPDAFDKKELALIRRELTEVK